MGPNGAGKSTIMKMILDLIQPDEGEVYLFGEKVTNSSYEIFKKAGSIIENPYFYEKMTARQNLELHCEYMGFPNKERIDEVLEIVGLTNVGRKQVRQYSLGMKQRLAIARAILARPEFLILDEPINALDPEGIREMRELFQQLNQENETTIFISSHILSEVDLIADTIGIIQQGKLLAELPMEEIHKRQAEYISLQVDNTARSAAVLEKMGITDFQVLDEEFIRIYGSDISGKVLFITVSLVDSMTDPSQTKDSFESTFLVIGLLMSFIFLVYSSVLTSRLVIREYEQKTITILFSYPLNREQLIISKLIIIMAYTAISMTVGYICCSEYMILADSFFDTLAGSFELHFLQTWIPTALITVAVCTILSLWPFIIGMVHKSVPATIVTSLIVIVLRQLMITKNPSNQESLLQIFLVAVVTFIFSFLIFRKKVAELY